MLVILNIIEAFLVFTFSAPLLFCQANVGESKHDFKRNISTSNNCPCYNSRWCDPIKDTTRKEVFAFCLSTSDSHWVNYDWSKLTTLVMTGFVSNDLMCMAHSANVKVSYIANVNIDFTRRDERQKWIEKQIGLMQQHFLDGINFDYESLIAEDDDAKRDGYTRLVAETNAALKKVMPYSQVTVDVAWKQNVDVRFYDYKGLADNSDFIFVMAYDEQSQIFGECLAMPNSALSKAMQGVGDYLDADIPPSKLVLGLPWYGYIYPCLSLVGDKCRLKYVPFRGVNCSDAAGREYDYSYITELIANHTVKWNQTSKTPYFSFSKNGTNYQVQFDNPQSLSEKYAFATKMNLRGVGMWNIDTLDYSDTAKGKENRKTMFGALPPYKDGYSVVSQMRHGRNWS